MRKRTMGPDQPFQREDENCEGEDLKCALALGVPAVVVLIVTLSIYLICRYVVSSCMVKRETATYVKLI